LKLRHFGHGIQQKKVRSPIKADGYLAEFPLLKKWAYDPEKKNFFTKTDMGSFRVYWRILGENKYWRPNYFFGFHDQNDAVCNFLHIQISKIAKI
jgi:hypothetical protein